MDMGETSGRHGGDVGEMVQAKLWKKFPNNACNYWIFSNGT